MDDFLVWHSAAKTTISSWNRREGMHPLPAWGGGGVKNSEKSLLGGSEIFILVGVYCWGGSVFSFCKMAGEQSIALLALEFEDQGAQIAHKFLTRFYCCIILSLEC